VKSGDLIRYTAFPHTELHNSGGVGLVVDEVYTRGKDSTLDVVDVIWSMDRGLSYPAGTVCWEYVDELEVIN
jgi:hypothetical protein